MIVEFRCEMDRPRLWMRQPADCITDNKNVSFQIAWAAGAPRPAGLETLFMLERILLRKGKPCGADAISNELLEANYVTQGKPDVVVDFTGATRNPTCRAPLYLRPLYNGRPGEDAALAAILAGDLPVIEILNDFDGHC